MLAGALACQARRMTTDLGGHQPTSESFPDENDPLPTGLHRKSELDHVPVLDDVVPAFQPHLAVVVGGLQ